MTEAKSFYDVVVVGGSLGTLAAGALLARRGFRVAYIPHGERSNVYTYNDLFLLRAPAALSFSDAPAFRRLMAELALTPLMRRRLHVPDPLFQVVLPSHRIDVGTSPDAVIAELEREFPEVRRPMEEFRNLLQRAMTDLDVLFGADLVWPPQGFFERREAARAASFSAVERRRNSGDILADFPADHPFRAFVLAQARFATALDPDGLAPLALLRAHGSAMRSAAFFEGGGRDALHKTLEDKIVQHGGEVRPRDTVARIVVSRGRVHGVDLAATDERLGCAFVLTSLDAAAALDLAGHTTTRTAIERLHLPIPRYYRYVLNVVLRTEGFPVGMASRVFSVQDLNRPLSEENLLAIETAPADGAKRVVLTVVALLPRSGVEEGESFLRWQRERLLSALQRVVPFLDRHLLVVDSPHDGLPLEDRAQGKTVVLAERWRGEPEPMAVLQAPDPNGFLGVCASSTRTEIKGLILAGRQVVAGVGEEGEIMAALSAARIITHTDRSKEKLRRELWSKVDA